MEKVHALVVLWAMTLVKKLVKEKGHELVEMLEEGKETKKGVQWVYEMGARMVLLSDMEMAIK
jgi:hypothetical protein